MGHKHEVTIRKTAHYLVSKGTFMSKLRVHCFSVSLDGYSAGPNQDLENQVTIPTIS
jgi:hypothetical protein